MEAFYELLKYYPSHRKSVPTLPCETWIVNISTSLHFTPAVTLKVNLFCVICNKISDDLTF